MEETKFQLGDIVEVANDQADRSFYPDGFRFRITKVRTELLPTCYWGEALADQEEQKHDISHQGVLEHNLKLAGRGQSDKIKPLKIPKDLHSYSILGQDKAKEHLKIAIKGNMPVLIVGDTGTGKTSMVKDLAKSMGAESVRFNLTGQTTVDDFVGKYTLEQGATKWQDGVLLNAMQNGSWLIVDEINVALPEILFVLHSLLDDEKAVLLAQKDGEVIKPHKNFRFFATMNPVDEYAGTKELNKAFQSRFNMVIKLDYPIPTYEKAIVKAKTGVADDVASKLVDIATSLRKAKANNEVFYTCSTRDLIQVGSLSKNMELSDAITLGMVNKATSERENLERVISGVVDDYKQFETESKGMLLDSLKLKMIRHQVEERKHEAKLMEQSQEHAQKLAERELQVIAGERKLKLKAKTLKAEVKKELLASLGATNG